MKNIILIAWIEKTGLRATGKLIRPDGINWAPEMECCNEAKACVFSRDLNEIDRAKKFAESEGYTVLVLPDSHDVLSVARNAMIQTSTN